MRATRQRAARDIVMQVLIRVFNLAIGVFVTALVVRTLGNIGYGQWSTIFIVLNLIGYLANFGMEGVAIREAAREPETEHEWVGSLMLLRLLVLMPVMVLSLGAVVILHQNHQMLIAGIILIVTMPFSGVGALHLIFQLRVNNFVPMLVLTLRSLLWGIAVAVIHWDGGGMIALAIAMSATNSVGSLVQTVAALRIVDRFPRLSRKQLMPLVRAALPIGIAGTLIISYARIDQIFVFTIVGSKAAGLYGAVYNVLDQAHFVPTAILTTLAPVFAASWPVDRARLIRTARLTAELMAVTSLGGLAFAIVASGPVVRLVFGEGFASAAPALPVLGGAFVFICFGYLNGNLLVVLGLQRRLLRISLIALVVNVIGNLILVPAMGFMGAAWMTLATEVVVFGVSLSLILRTLELSLPKPARMGRTVLAAAVMGGCLVALRAVDAPLGLLTAAALISYPALLFGLRALAIEDVRVLLRRGTIA